MSERGYATVEDIRRLADFAHAATLAQRGQVAMAREIMARYSICDRPQIIAEVGIDVLRR
jgi:hypothetical protein